MKTSIILVIFCAIATISAGGVDMRKMIRAEAEKCIEKTGADPEVLKKLRDGEDAVVDDNVKCFGACMMKALGVIAEDGTVDTELTKSMIPQDSPNRDNLLAAIDACANEKGANECETGHAIAMCINKNTNGAMA